MNEGIEIVNPEREDPEAVIRALMGEASVMGRNDSEFSQFHQILDALKEKSISPEEAVLRAREIRNGKQDH